jgi:hypothetical protein
MLRTPVLARVLLALGLLLALVAPASAKDGGTYQTGFVGWRAAAGGFSTWTRNGVALAADGALKLDLATASNGSDTYLAGGYYGGNYYNGGSFLVGEATSPIVKPNLAFSEAIASWNATTPPGTWIETQISAQIGTRWTKWYSLGIWDDDNSTVARHSVKLQGDADGFIAVDTLVISAKKAAASAFQLKLRLFSANGTAIPTVRNAAVAYSTTPPAKASAVTPSTPGLTNTSLTLPECSQMVYPDGGEVWCSPTSTSMVLGYWGFMPGDCQPRVRAAVAGVYDWIYDGHGNWPFNTAYAATNLTGSGTPLEGYVARFTSLSQAEPWIAAGVPVVMSIAWGKGDLTNPSIASTAGHLLVLVGFDAAGNPIVNDPAGLDNAQVHRTYLRSEFEPLWVKSSGGTVYLIYPQGKAVPSL